MKTRPLGKSKIEVGEVSLGTWGLATSAYGNHPGAEDGKTRQEVFEAVVLDALDAGIRDFDLAPLWEGSEQTVAKLTATKRSDVRYITRAGAVYKGGQVMTRYEPYDLITDCEASLKRLGTDHIDVWLLHNPPEYLLHRDDWASTATRLKEDGKVRAWGVSVGDRASADRAIAAGADVIALTYNILHSDLLHGLTNSLAQAGTGVFAHSPLMYGLLGGRWTVGHAFREGDHRKDRWTDYALSTRIRQVDKLSFLRSESDGSLLSPALAYVLGNKSVSSVVVGPRSVPQLRAVLATAEHAEPLSDELKAKIPSALASA